MDTIACAIPTAVTKDICVRTGIVDDLRDLLIRGILSIRKLRPRVHDVLLARERRSQQYLRFTLSVHISPSVCMRVIRSYRWPRSNTFLMAERMSLES